jgi:putative oxidoreductase
MERATTTANRFEAPVYAALRILAGLMFATHGMQKLFGWFGAPMQPPAGSQLWFAGLIELVCGLLIAVGLFTRPAAFLAAGEMAVAYFMAHWRLSLGGGQWVPVVNKGELAALYSLLFLFITAYGPGVASLDALFRRPTVRREPEPFSTRPLAGEHGGGE